MERKRSDADLGGVTSISILWEGFPAGFFDGKCWGFLSDFGLIRKACSAAARSSVLLSVLEGR